MKNITTISWIVVGLIFILIIGLITLMFKYNKEGKIAKSEKIKRILTELAYYAVIQAEFVYHDGHGKEKLEYAIKKVKSQLPSVLAFFINKQMIVNAIEYALSELQLIFKSQKEEKQNILNKIIEVGTKSGDIAETIKVAENLKENRGYVEGYAEVKSDFHGQTNAAAGVRAGIKL